MDPETTPPPPEARLIRTAREAAGRTAASAAKATEGAVSAAYWRDVERGCGYRRGQLVPTKGSARVIAHMAAVFNLDPGRLEAEGKRPDAAGILREINRKEVGAPPRPDVMHAVPGDGDTASAIFPKDQSKQDIWRLNEPEETRAALVKYLDQLRREAGSRNGHREEDAG